MDEEPRASARRAENETQTRPAPSPIRDTIALAKGERNEREA